MHFLCVNKADLKSKRLWYGAYMARKLYLYLTPFIEINWANYKYKNKTEIILKEKSEGMFMILEKE